MASGIGRGAAVERDDRRTGAGRIDHRPSARSTRRRRPPIQGRSVLRAGSRWERRIRPAPVFDHVPTGRWRHPRLPRPARFGRGPHAATVGAAPRRPSTARTAEGPVHRRRDRSATATPRGHGHRDRAPAVDPRDTPPGRPRRPARDPPGRRARRLICDRPRRAVGSRRVGVRRANWYVPAVSRPADAANTGWRGATGRLDALLPDIIARDGVDPDATLAFVSGNPSLVAAVRLVLCRSGMPIDAIRTETWS